MGSIFLTALLAIAGRLVSQQLFETVATRAIIWLLQKLAAMSETRLDDEIVADIVARLSPPPPAPAVNTSTNNQEIDAALSRHDFVEAARLINLANKNV